MDTPIPSTGERMLGLKSRHYANMGWIGQNGPEGGGTATATATAAETVTDGSAIMDGNADGPEYTDGTEKRPDKNGTMDGQNTMPITWFTDKC